MNLKKWITNELKWINYVVGRRGTWRKRGAAHAVGPGRPGGDRGSAGRPLEPAAAARTVWSGTAPDGRQPEAADASLRQGAPAALGQSAGGAQLHRRWRWWRHGRPPGGVHWGDRHAERWRRQRRGRRPLPLRGRLFRGSRSRSQSSTGNVIWNNHN